MRNCCYPRQALRHAAETRFTKAPQTEGYTSRWLAWTRTKRSSEQYTWSIWAGIRHCSRQGDDADSQQFGKQNSLGFGHAEVTRHDTSTTDEVVIKETCKSGMAAIKTVPPSNLGQDQGRRQRECQGEKKLLRRNASNPFVIQLRHGKPKRRAGRPPCRVVSPSTPAHHAGQGCRTPTCSPFRISLPFLSASDRPC